MELSLVPRSVYPWTHLLFDLYFLCTFSSLPALSGFIRPQNALAVFLFSLLPGHLELAEDAARRIMLKCHGLPGFRMRKGQFIRRQGHIRPGRAGAASCTAPAPSAVRRSAVPRHAHPAAARRRAARRPKTAEEAFPSVCRALAKTAFIRRSCSSRLSWLAF